MKKEMKFYESPRAEFAGWSYASGLLVQRMIDPGALAENEDYEPDEI